MKKQLENKILLAKTPLFSMELSTFETKFNELIQKETKKSQFIPPKVLISKILNGFVPTNWRKELITRPNGLEKLNLIDQFLNQQEQDLINLMLSDKENWKIYDTFINRYYKKWYDTEELNTTDNNHNKPNIVINIGKSNKLDQLETIQDNEKIPVNIDETILS